MKDIQLIANTGSEKRILKYLQGNASYALIDRINNGIQIELDGKQLINKKTLAGFMRYATDEARKIAEKGSTSACIEGDVVFGWAIHYFEENTIQEKLFNLDGTEYKKEPIKTAPKISTPKIEKPKNQDIQASFFDMLDDNANEEPINGFDEDNKEDEEVISEEVKEAPKPQISPIYTTYMNYQDKNQNAVIAYRLGDFYEIFGDKAKAIYQELDLTLTARRFGTDESIPMVGFPYHCADKFFNKITTHYDLIIIDGEDIRFVPKMVEKIDYETGEIISEDSELISKLYNLFGTHLEVKQ